MMLMLKMLALKVVKKYVNIYKCKLSPFGRDDTKTRTTRYIHCGPSISKSSKKRMLDVVTTYNKSNYKLT